MHDAIQYTYANFDITKTNNGFFVDVRRAQVWSVQLVVERAMTACTVELRMSNDGKNGVAFSPVKELAAAGFLTTIDCGGLALGFLEVHVKTASVTTDETVNVIIVGRTDNGTGKIERYDWTGTTWAPVKE